MNIKNVHKSSNHFEEKLLCQNKGFFFNLSNDPSKKCNNRKIDEIKEYIFIESFFNLSKSKKDKKVFLF